MRTLITGANGFLGSYLVKELKENGHEVYATGLDEKLTIFGDKTSKLDICDINNINDVINLVKPEVLVHLAAISFVPFAEKNIEETLLINVAPVENLIKACSEFNTKFVFISSAEVYGHTAKNNEFLTEDLELKPGNFYSLSKLMGEKIVEKNFNSGILKDYVIIRPFNSVGFGQNSNFALSSFAEQIKSKSEIEVGNLEVYRDFINVKDTVRGIRLACESGHGIYNFCSGTSYLLSELLSEMILISGKHIIIKVDPNRFRKAEVLNIKGCYKKAKNELGWEPNISINQTLKEILNF